MSFIDRSDAGKKLALALQRYKGKDVVVLALPRGGVQVAVEIARYLRAPLELLLVRKIGVPSQPELAMGAVVDGLEPIVVRNEEVFAWPGFQRLNSTPYAAAKWPNWSADAVATSVVGLLKTFQVTLLSSLMTGSQRGRPCWRQSAG